MHTAIWSHPVLSRLPICRSGNGEWKTPKYRNNDSIHSLGCLRNDHFKKMLYSSPIMSFGRPEKKGRSSYKAVVHASSVKEDINGVDELEAGRRNPGLSGNYRPLTKLKPNATVLEAQGRICTGPTQTRPLNEQQAFKVLDTILQSGPPPVADVRSLTHYGEPYDGNTRFFRSTLFVAAVRASYGEACLLHGVEWMPPKGGITEEQMLDFMGASTSLSPAAAVKLLEDDQVGFAYISQREARPFLHSLIGLREHIKKRPPIATTEKVQQYVKATGRESMMAGFYHEGYEDPLLMLMRRRGVDSGLVVKGEEGSLSLTTKSRSINASKGPPVNHCAGFRTLTAMEPDGTQTDGFFRETFRIEVNAADYGFQPTETPRTDRSVAKNIELGLSALRGQKGPAYDRIVLNAAMADHLLGCSGASDISCALERSKEAIDSGRALNRFLNYVEMSHTVK